MIFLTSVTLEGETKVISVPKRNKTRDKAGPTYLNTYKMGPYQL